MIVSKPAKTLYSETEAAEALGVSVEQLRALIKNHIVDVDEDLLNSSVANFQPSDLLLLKILSGQSSNPTR